MVKHDKHDVLQILSHKTRLHQRRLGAGLQNEPAALPILVDDGKLLFSGMRVRMSIATGTADQPKVSMSGLQACGAFQRCSLS